MGGHEEWGCYTWDLYGSDCTRRYRVRTSAVPAANPLCLNMQVVGVILNPKP